MIRVGIVGAGDNTRSRHIPGFNAVRGVEIVGVVNRSRQTSEKVASQFKIPKVYDHWLALVESDQIDAVCIGTWPYMHCPVTLAALESGKHVLTEARMAMNAREAHAMLAASRRNPHLVTQIVPSPHDSYPGSDHPEATCGRLPGGGAGGRRTCYDLIIRGP